MSESHKELTSIVNFPTAQVFKVYHHVIHKSNQNYQATAKSYKREKKKLNKKAFNPRI